MQARARPSAQFIAEDKGGIIISEKIAALNVVYRRLREVGLSEFCLEVHSNKASEIRSTITG